MKREVITPRTNNFERVAALGMLHAGTPDMPYWDESACYSFTQDQIETIEYATAELHCMCLKAVQHVIDHNLFERLKIPAAYIPLIKKSWERKDPFIYGRFDLAYDGVHPPKMLEFNADTPTSLLEASVIQHYWLKEKKAEGKLPAEADQFNSIHESLVRAWQKVKREMTLPPGKIHFACCTENAEDAQTTHYIDDAAREAGFNTEDIDIGDIGSDGKSFLDRYNRAITTVFKLYPWEWLLQDPYGQQTLTSETRFIEPAWKMILSNKGIMMILWEMFPHHPNLIPTFDQPEKIQGPYVKKPFISREGANVSICGTPDAEVSEGNYGKEGYIYQAYVPLPNFDGNIPIIGSWITSSDPEYPLLPSHPRGGEACGLGIREDKSRITNNESRFIPHYMTASL